MDQMVSCQGRENELLAIDCHTEQVCRFTIILVLVCFFMSSRTSARLIQLDHRKTLTVLASLWYGSHSDASAMACRLVRGSQSLRACGSGEWTRELFMQFQEMPTALCVLHHSLPCAACSRPAR
jgi:hypothetical protein